MREKRPENGVDVDTNQGGAELEQAAQAVESDRARLAADLGREQEIERELATRKTIIIVNTRERIVEGSTVSFNQLVGLAFDPVPTGANVEFTITYRRGPAEKPEGTVAPGQTVSIKSGEIFNVTCTDRS